MAHKVSAIELRRMSPEDLSREMKDKQAHIAKMRLGLQIGSEKDIAKYRRERKEFARMSTVHSEHQKAAPAKTPALKKRASSAKVSAPASKE